MPARNSCSLASVTAHPAMSFWIRPLYTLLSCLFLPVALVRLGLRMLKDPAYRPHWRERFAIGSVPTETWINAPQKIWIHAVSLGETRAVASLVRALAEHYPHAMFLLTHTTPNGRIASESLIRPALGNRLNVRYLPYDVPGIIDRFVARWSPSVCLLMETELWPHQLRCNQAHNIPTLLINARLSQRSARKYARAGRLTRPMLHTLTGILAQDQSASRRFQTLGFQGPSLILGNLKFDPIPPSPEQIALGKQLRAAWNNTPTRIILASSRPGEEAEFLKALSAHQLSPSSSSRVSAPIAITIVPRHIERCDEITALAEQEGWHVQRKSLWKGEHIDPSTTLFLGDTIGELIAYYQANEIALLGGSFGHYGAQNPLEALAAGCALIIGPSRFNFHSITQTALRAHAAVSAPTMNDALNWIQTALNSPELFHSLQAAGQPFCEAQRGTLQRYIDALAPFLLNTQTNHAQPSHKPQ